MINSRDQKPATGSPQTMFADFKFGFEYETIVQILNQAQFNTILKASKPKKYAHDMEDYNYDQLLALAIMYKQRDPTLNILAEWRDNGQFQYKTIDGGGLDIAARPYTAWLVTFDGSVSSLGGYGEKRVQLYRNIHDKAYTDVDLAGIISSVEIVSPVLHMKDINQVSYFVNEVALANGSLTYWNNYSTSIHIHISCGQIFEDPRNLFKIYMAWWFFEPVIMMMVAPFKRKRTIHRYLKRKFTDQVENLLLTITDDTNNNIRTVINIFQGAGRSCSLNCQNLGFANPQRRTIEIRALHGTSDGEEITMFIKFIRCFMYNIIKRPCPSTFDAFTKRLALSANAELLAMNKIDLNTNKSLIKIFMSYITDRAIAKYWLNNIAMPKLELFEGHRMYAE